MAFKNSFITQGRNFEPDANLLGYIKDRLEQKKDKIVRALGVDWNWESFKVLLGQCIEGQRLKTDLDWKNYFTHYDELKNDFEKSSEEFLRTFQSPINFLYLEDRMAIENTPFRCLDVIARRIAKRRKLKKGLGALSSKMKGEINGYSQMLLAYARPHFDVRKTQILDFFAQCAEDNAMGTFINYLKINKHKIQTLTVSWIATRRDETQNQGNYNLCPVCGVRFQERLQFLIIQEGYHFVPLTSNFQSN
mmetsp:Transcript_19057/g.19794  ORF Transcript_19057/g.19794 Transcript_19057/m.19794 type:complete len:249 (-) Transcript_19057:99-845(-)